MCWLLLGTVSSNGRLTGSTGCTICEPGKFSASDHQGICVVSHPSRRDATLIGIAAVGMQSCEVGTYSAGNGSVLCTVSRHDCRAFLKARFRTVLPERSAT